MRRILKNLILSLGATVWLFQASMGQVQFQIPVTFTVASGPPHTTVLTFGVSGDGPGGSITDNTYGVDLGTQFGAYEEFPLPPAPPTPIWDLRWVDSRVPPPPFPNGLDTGLEGDYHGFSSSAQVDSHKVQLLGSDVQLTSVVVSWPSNLSTYATALILKSPLGLFPQVDMLAQTTVTLNGALAAAGGIYIIQTGAVSPSPGPTFSISPAAPLAFGSVGIGGSLTLLVTVSNPGTANALVITSAPAVPADYTVAPNPPASYPITIPALGSHGFDVTFSPTVAGPRNGDIVWTHNAPGSPTSYAVTGTGTSQGGTFQFAAPSRTRFDNTTGYSDDLQLVNYVGGDLKAMQFRLITNGLLIFRSISKGTDISTPSNAWNFNFVIARGPVNADGSSNDTVKVVLYGNGNVSLPAGTYNNLIHFEYDVVNISDPDVQTTTIDLPPSSVVGSLGDGTNAGIVAGPSQTITVNNRTLLGDVNDDGSIDILDLLEVVDHILDIDILTGEAFTRADIAPWTPGNPAPTPDGVVNVQDLALLQQIILTGVYPDGTPIGAPAVQQPAPIAKASTIPATPSKLGQGVDARLTLYVTKDGISLRLDNAVSVKGIQLELGDVIAPDNAEISTLLGQGFYHQNTDALVVLLYNQSAISLVQPGERIVGNMPFAIPDPTKLTVKDVIIAGVDNKAVENVEVVISLSEPPELPVDFALFQNYPNPFNPSTNIRFSVPELSHVRLTIYNLLGEQVRTLFAGQMDRGTKSIEWDGRDDSGLILPSGVYLYQMIAGNFIQAHKMVLVK